MWRSCESIPRRPDVRTDEHPTANERPATSRGVSLAPRTRIMANSIYSLASYVVYLPVSLFLSSYVVHRLGIVQYGIWATLTALLGYGSLLDLGLSSPVIRYVAEYMALGQRAEVNSLVNTALVCYACLGSTGAAVMIAGSGWALTHLFRAQHETVVYQLYIVVAIGFAVSLTFSVFQSLVIGMQRSDLFARVTLALNLVTAAITILAVHAGMGISGLALTWAVSICLTITANLILAKRLFPGLVINPLLFRFDVLKLIWRYGSRIQVTSLTLVLNDQVDRTLIAYALGPASLGYFSLGSRVAAALRGVSFSLLAGIMPAASDASAVDQQERLKLLYLRSARYVNIADFGLCAGVGGLAYPLITAWLGLGYGRIAATLIVILVGYIVWLPSQAASDILNGAGRPEIRMRADLAFLLIHIPLSTFLIWRFGYFGTLVGTSAALSVTRIYVYVVGSRLLGVTLAELCHFSVVQPALGSLLALTVVVVPQVAGVSYSFWALLAGITAFVTVYAVYILKFGLDEYDCNLLRAHVLPTLRRIVSPFQRVTQ